MSVVNFVGCPKFLLGSLAGAIVGGAIVYLYHRHETSKVAELQRQTAYKNGTTEWPLLRADDEFDEYRAEAKASISFKPNGSWTYNYDGSDNSMLTHWYKMFKVTCTIEPGQTYGTVRVWRKYHRSEPEGKWESCDGLDTAFDCQYHMGTCTSKAVVWPSNIRPPRTLWD